MESESDSDHLTDNFIKSVFENCCLYVHWTFTMVLRLCAMDRTYVKTTHF